MITLIFMKNTSLKQTNTWKAAVFTIIIISMISKIIIIFSSWEL